MLIETTVVLVIAVIVLKPADIVLLLKTISNIRKHVYEIRDSFFKALDGDEITLLKSEIINEINFYLSKIHEMNITYEGEYDLEKIRTFYLNAIKKEHEKSLCNEDEI